MLLVSKVSIAVLLVQVALSSVVAGGTAAAAPPPSGLATLPSVGAVP